MTVWFYSLVSVVVVSAVSLVGVFTLSLRRERLRKLTVILVSFAVGALMGDALIHLIPQAYGELGLTLGVSLFVLLGMLLFFLLEKFLRWRHCHDTECAWHMGDAVKGEGGRVHPVVVMNLIGDAVHNCIDGMVIAASYLVSVPLGVATTVAVVGHEIPQEIGDFGVLVHGGLPIRRALAFNFLSSLAALLGAVLSLVVGPHVKDYAPYLVPLTAGGFLYIAGSDLIPELQHDVGLGKSAAQLVAVLAGVGVMVLLKVWE